MTDLHRRTAKVMGAVIYAQETVEITDNSNVVAKIVSEKKCNPKAALAILLEMGKGGTIHIKPRK
jgi:antitoxin (DNA-binding transcriptional repressor) of toxin-antitoxin stability system